VLVEFPKKYLSKIKGYSNAFKKDVYDTCLRIHAKDGKSFGLRIHRSVSKRFKCARNNVAITLLWFEHCGLLTSRLETVEEFRSRMALVPGLYQRGRRRKYYKPGVGRPSCTIGRGFDNTYRKLTYKDLGIEYNENTEYPV
jgi:hypothetical protein